MCCRYYIEDTTEMQAIVSDMMRSSLVRKWNELYPIKTYGEMSPTDIVPVIASNRNRQRAVFPMKWGFTGKTLLMNARVETASIKPTFRDAWKSHRCIVPASYYFEWEHLIGNNGKTKTGDKYAIQPQGSSMTWLCGLYRFENDGPFVPAKDGRNKTLRSAQGNSFGVGHGTVQEQLNAVLGPMPFFVILTREPGEQIRFIHDRMPLILPEHMVNSWIDPDADPEELVKEAVTDVVAEKAG